MFLFSGIVRLHQFYEIVEQKVCIVRAATGFRVELNAEGRNVGICDAFNSSVVYVEERHFCVRRQ